MRRQTKNGAASEAAKAAEAASKKAASRAALLQGLSVTQKEEVPNVELVGEEGVPQEVVLKESGSKKPKVADKKPAAAVTSRRPSAVEETEVEKDEAEAPEEATEPAKIAPCSTNASTDASVDASTNVATPQVVAEPPKVAAPPLKKEACSYAPPPPKISSQEGHIGKSTRSETLKKSDRLLLRRS